MAFFEEANGCCAYGIAYAFPYDNGKLPGRTSTIDRDFWNSRRHSFVAVFRPDQSKAFFDVCKQHKLLSVTKIKGNDAKHLALCVFKWGK